MNKLLHRLHSVKFLKNFDGLYFTFYMNGFQLFFKNLILNVIIYLGIFSEDMCRIKLHDGHLPGI